MSALKLLSRSTSQSHSLSRMAAVWLLPVVTLIVASSTGGLLSAALRPESATLATLTTALSFTMVTIGLSLAIMMITVYLARLICYGPPDANLILSAFLVLGPLGQGGYSLLLNGSDLAELLPLYTTNQLPGMSQSGQIVYAVCFCAAYILWSMGICWIIIAICSIFSVAKSSGLPPFGLAYWGLIFPNGVFALLSIQLGVVLQSPFFHGFGALWSCASHLCLGLFDSTAILFFGRYHVCAVVGHTCAHGSRDLGPLYFQRSLPCCCIWDLWQFGAKHIDSTLCRRTRGWWLYRRIS